MFATVGRRALGQFWRHYALTGGTQCRAMLPEQGNEIGSFPRVAIKPRTIALQLEDVIYLNNSSKKNSFHRNEFLNLAKYVYLVFKVVTQNADSVNFPQSFDGSPVY